MKVYVDKLPKSCDDCEFGYFYDCQYCTLRPDLMKKDEWCEKEKHCPLENTQSLKQQVRNEVYEKIIKFINELAWEDVKYDAYQSTMEEFTGSTSAIPRYAKKYFDLWEELYNEKLEQIEKRRK